jgi:hypothetical protein
MSGTPEPERLNQEGFATFAARSGENAPVTMLNLLRFKPDGGRERYAEYGAAVTPLLEKAGARVVFLGEAALPLLGDGRWDSVLMVEYRPARRSSR